MVRSTDVDRTLNSAEANLAGIFGDYYNSHPKQQFREGLPWRPTPIHTVPGSLDTVSGDLALCLKLDPRSLFRGPKMLDIALKAVSEL